MTVIISSVRVLSPCSSQAPDSRTCVGHPGQEAVHDPVEMVSHAL